MNYEQIIQVLNVLSYNTITSQFIACTGYGTGFYQQLHKETKLVKNRSIGTILEISGILFRHLPPFF